MIKETNIEIWSAIMGSGKTMAIIKILNRNPKGKIIFVTEYNDEIERILHAVTSNTIHEPLASHGEGSKKKHLLKLLSAGVNVATTHALFAMLQKEDYHLLEGYTMFLDEVLNVIEKIAIAKRDIQLLLRDNVIGIDSSQKLFVIDSEYNGEFEKRVARIEKGETFLFQNQLIWSVSPDIFKSLKHVIITTYNFEGSYMYNYFRMHKFTIRIKVLHSAGRFKVSNYINLYNGKLNDKNSKPKKFTLGDGGSVNKTPLASGYYKLATKSKLSHLSKRATNFFRYWCKTPSSLNAYAVYEKQDEKLTNDRFGDLIAVNARATNKYGYKRSMAYLVDMYPDPTIENYFKSQGVKMDENAWSLSVLLQWIFRGCIRNVGNESLINSAGDWDKLNLFIPSFRMRTLFEEWLRKH